MSFVRAADRAWAQTGKAGKVDVILATHGHGDHTGDVSELAKRTGATVLGPAGLIATIIDLGWVAPEKARVTRASSAPSSWTRGKPHTRRRT